MIYITQCQEPDSNSDNPIAEEADICTGAYGYLDNTLSLCYALARIYVKIPSWHLLNIPR